MRPGIIPLRPLRLGEVYDGAFAAIRSNPGPILGFSAVIAVVLAAINGVVTWLFEGKLLHTLDSGSSSLFSPSTTASSSQELDQIAKIYSGALPTFVVAILLALVAGAILSGVVTVSVSAAVLGRRVRAQELWAQVRPRLLPLVGLALLTTLLVLLVAVVCLLPGGVLLAVGAASSSSGTVVGAVVLLVLGGLAAFAAAYALQIRLLLAPCALILEPQPVRAAIKRSWVLTRHGFWRLLGIELLTTVGLAIVSGIVSVPFSLVGTVAATAAGHGAAATAIPLVASGVGSAIARTILDPLAAAVVALLYIDARMRREGLDVELAQAAAAQAAASPA